MGCVASERPTFGMGAGCWFGICTESAERLEPREDEDVMRFLFHVGRIGLRLGTLGIGGLEGSGWEVDVNVGDVIDGLTRAGRCAGGEPVCRPSRRSPHLPREVSYRYFKFIDIMMLALQVVVFRKQREGS